MEVEPVYPYRLAGSRPAPSSHRSLYEAAVSEMVTRTSTLGAPWLLIPGTDKKFARVEILSEICGRLEKALKD